MGYVGTAPLSGDYRKLDDISGTFNGDDNVTFNLTVSSIAVTPPKETTMLISVGGILQEPVSAYTVSGSTITFTAAPATGADFFGILLGDTMAIGTPSDGTITGAKVASAGLLATDIKIGEDSQTMIDFETANEIHFDADNAERVKIDATGLNIVSGSLETATIDFTDGDLAMTIADGGGVTFAQNAAFSGTITLDSDSNGIILGDGQDTSIYATSNSLRISNLLAGNAQEIDWYTADSDGTDNVIHIIWGVGTPTGYTNRERLQYGKIGNEWVFNSDAAGTGTVRPIVLQTGGTDRLEIGIAGGVYINDTANANITTGLTINQGAADNQILALKSSDVAHGVTTNAETDTYGSLSKAQATSGGLVVGGYKDADGIAGAALQLTGVLGEAAHTDTDGSAYAVINLISKVADGTGTAVVADAGNMASFSNGGSATKWLIKGNGDVWQNGDLTLADNKVINLGEAGKIDFGDEAPLDNAATGIVFSFIAGATLAIGDVVYIGTGGKVLEADANQVTTMPAIGICVSAGSDTDTVDVLVQGIMHDTSAFPTFSTVGADIFVSAAATGAVVDTAPSGSGDTIQKIGVALHADMIYFNFNTTEVLLA